MIYYKQFTVHYRKLLNNHYIIFPSVLFITIALVYLIVIRAEASLPQPTFQVDIYNEIPTIPTAPIISYAQNGDALEYPIILIEGATKSIYIHGTVHDANGSNDITEVTVTFYDSATTDSNCTTDNTDACYRMHLKHENDSTNILCGSNNGNTTCSYFVKIPLTFHTNPSFFKAAVTAIDHGQVASAIKESAKIKINSLLALSADESIDYGTVFVGDSSTKVIAINNVGNVMSDIQVKSEDLLCDQSGIIPARLIAFDRTALSNIDTDFTDFDLPKQIGELIGSATTNVQMTLGPVNDVLGLCTGALKLTALGE